MFEQELGVVAKDIQGAVAFMGGLHAVGFGGHEVFVKDDSQNRDVVAHGGCEIQAGHVEGSNALISLLASVLKRENLFSHCQWKVDKNKPIFVEEVVLTAFIDNPYKIVFGRPGSGDSR